MPKIMLAQLRQQRLPPDTSSPLTLRSLLAKFTRHHETAERILGRMALRFRLGLFGETV